MAKILGIDCSTNSLAFSVFEDGKLAHWGEVRFGKGDALHRAYNANKTTTALADDTMLFDIDEVCYEQAVYINNRKTVIDLSMLLGAAISPFIRPGVKCVSVPPVTWQSYIGNKPFTRQEKDELRANNPGKSVTWLAGEMRRIRKERTISWVEKELGVRVHSDDVADAIGVGFWKVNNGS